MCVEEGRFNDTQEKQKSNEERRSERKKKREGCATSCASTALKRRQPGSACLVLSLLSLLSLPLGSSASHRSTKTASFSSLVLKDLHFAVFHPLLVHSCRLSLALNCDSLFAPSRCAKKRPLSLRSPTSLCALRAFFSRNWREAAPPFLSSFLSRLFLVFSLSTFVFLFLPRRKAKRQGTPPAKFFPGDSVWATRPAAASVEARREW